MDNLEAKFRELSVVPTSTSTYWPSTPEPFDTALDAQNYFAKYGVPLYYARLLFKLRNLSLDLLVRGLERDGWENWLMAQAEGLCQDHNLFKLSQDMEYLAGIYITYREGCRGLGHGSLEMGDHKMDFSWVLPALYRRQILCCLARAWPNECRFSSTRVDAVMGNSEKGGLLGRPGVLDEELTCSLDFFFNRLAWAMRGPLDAQVGDPDFEVKEKLHYQAQTMSQINTPVAYMKYHDQVVQQALRIMPSLMLNTNQDLNIQSVYYLLFGSSCYRISCIKGARRPADESHEMWCANRREKARAFSYSRLLPRNRPGRRRDMRKSGM